VQPGLRHCPAMTCAGILAGLQTGTPLGRVLARVQLYSDPLEVHAPLLSARRQKQGAEQRAFHFFHHRVPVCRVNVRLIEGNALTV
jgi:hypothetical protein